MRWIRKRVGWFAGIGIGGLVLWLIGTAVSLQTTQTEAAGTLFGKKVPASRYLRALEAVTHQAILQHGDQYRQKVPGELLDTRAWERLTLLSEAKRRKIRVLDQEVIEELQRWPIFQTNGRFDSQGYRAIVQYSLGTSPRDFEEEIRENLILEKLVDSVIGKVTVTEEELREGFRQREESIKVRSVAFPEERLASEAAHVARQQPQELLKIAKQLDLKVTSTDFFKRTSQIPEIGSAGSIFGPAFSLKPGEVTGPLRGPQGWLVVQLQEKQAPDEERFHQVKQTLEQELTTQKKLRTYLTWYQDLIRRADLKK